MLQMGGVTSQHPASLEAITQRHGQAGNFQSLIYKPVFAKSLFVLLARTLNTTNPPALGN